MKFQTTRNNLLDTALFVNKMINPKISSPILNGMMIDVGKELTLYSTDLETSIKSTVPVVVYEEGKAVVLSKIFINILKSLKESKVDIEFDKLANQIKISCGNALFTLNTLPAGEFPSFPEIKKEKQIKINIDKFKDLVLKVQKAASIDESRTVLTGIFFNIEDGVFNMVATDSYRLALVKNEIGEKSSTIGVTVPAKVLDSIAKSEYRGSDININIEENQISFYPVENEQSGQGKDVIVTRLLSGKFPDYKQLLPDRLKHEIAIDRNKMLDVVRRITSISQDSVPVKLTIDSGRISVSMSIREIGSSSEDFEIPYEGERIEISFNPEFLMDGLNIMDCDKIIMSIDEPLKPITIKPEKKDNPIYLLMPMRVV
ncbi:MAG: DNA polymerase III subunit beta [Candidatus Humimicrobiaceae bacterium]|jgi:DNA polymerase-3 subunit beta|nr:DNA polymerase III subunit beta [Actinomycetota bacterium]MDY0027763.1 DNA polymerase III subunit beta [Candidatus Humimicrobiaceae bacterium]